MPFSPAHKASQWSENSACLWSVFSWGWRSCKYFKAQAVFKTQNLIFLFLWVQTICSACLPSSNEVKLLQCLLSYQHQSNDNILEAGEVNKPHGQGSMLSFPYCRWVSLGCLKVFSWGLWLCYTGIETKGEHLSTDDKYGLPLHSRCTQRFCITILHWGKENSQVPNTWGLKARIKHLSLALYHYTLHQRELVPPVFLHHDLCHKPAETSKHKTQGGEVVGGI